MISAVLTLHRPKRPHEEESLPLIMLDLPAEVGERQRYKELRREEGRWLRV